MVKQVIGDPLVINGRRLSLSRAVRAGDYVFLTGQVPMRDGQLLIKESIEDQTRAVLEEIRSTLIKAGGDLGNVVKSMVWLKSRDDFPGFNEVYSEYFHQDPPARSAVINDLLVDVKIEIEVVAYMPRDTNN